MMPGIRDYLRRAANLRRRGLAVKYSQKNVPPAQWGSPERRAAAKEQMELVQGLADSYVMEKFWRTLEIVCSYPDFFTKDQQEIIRGIYEGLFQPDWSGTIEYRFRTPQAHDFVTLLREHIG